jgi:thiamine-phosphate pyrophosphorylase
MPRVVGEYVRGFYAILDRDDEQLARALAAAMHVLQVRLKDAPASDLVRVGRMARRVCDQAGAALVMNDRFDVALAVGADGVHLGQTDLPIEAVRPLAGKLWIGVSTHNVSQVARAVAAGADYLGFGPVFATTSKANPDPVQGIAGLRSAVAAARGVPIVAIGGISAEHASEIYAAGASAIAAISAVNGSPDPAYAARQFSP